MTATEDKTVTHYRTVPIVVSGATWSVTFRWDDCNLRTMDVNDVQPIAGQTYDPQGYDKQDRDDAISEEGIRLLNEIVASGFDQEVW